MQRLETEAKTLTKLLAVETKSMWPPVIDHITVEKGYETALGAALGDDLDAPVDPSPPMRWVGAAVDPSDPALPEGVAVARRNTCRRRRNWRAASRRSASSSAPTAHGSPRCSSPASGWSRAKAICGAGTASPPTPTRRPARRAASPQRSRLADIDAELATARADVEDKRKAGRSRASGR